LIRLLRYGDLDAGDPGDWELDKSESHGKMLLDLINKYKTNMKEGMMAIRELDSNQARTQWRDILDEAQAGESDVVVERYGKPVVAVIPYADFEAVQDELDDLRAARRAGAAYEAWKRDPGQAVPYERFRAELVTERLLDG